MKFPHLLFPLLSLAFSDDAKPTIPELAKKLGYPTAHFEKNGIGLFHHGRKRLEKAILPKVGVGQKETRINREFDLRYTYELTPLRSVYCPA